MKNVKIKGIDKVLIIGSGPIIIGQGRPNIVDAIHNREIQLIVNTAVGKRSKHDDSYIRKTAIRYKVPYITTTAAARAAAEGIRAYLQAGEVVEVKSLQEYHRDIS
jgi:carbamoyl-phosphate synthase large subunit